MSGHVGRQIRLSASRVPPSGLHNRLAFHHEPAFSMTLQAPGTRRNFSIQPARDVLVTISNTLLEASDSLITNIHTVTGAPWFITLPLVALTVTVTVRGPFAIYDQRLAQRRATLGALLNAQYSQLGHAIRRKDMSDNKIRKDTQKGAEAAAKRIYKKWGLQPWKSMVGGFVGIPVLVANLEIIRRMCGGPRGLLGTLLYGPQVAGKDAAVEAAAATTASDSAEILPVIDVSSGAGELPAATSHLIAADPTMATGGILWFPNLLEPDPYHVLPFLLSAVLLTSVLPKSSFDRMRALFVRTPTSPTEGKAIALGQSPARIALRRTMVGACVAIGFVTMDFPSAIHVYWISTVLLNSLIRQGVKKAMPVPKFTVKPCRGLETPLLRPRPISTSRK